MSRSLTQKFINSAVRQVGRDAGKVISNVAFGDSHSTPIRMVGSKATSPEVTSKTALIGDDEWDYSVQPTYSGEFSSWWQCAGYMLFATVLILPLVWTLVFGIGRLIRKQTTLYATIPNRARERRFKVGYREEGTILIPTEHKRMYTKEESSIRRSEGFVLLATTFFWPVGWMLAVLFALIKK